VTGPARRGGRIVESDGRVVAWSMAEGGDDLGVRVVEASARRLANGTFELRTVTGVRRARLDDAGLPAADEGPSTSWPLERA